MKYCLLVFFILISVLFGQSDFQLSHSQLKIQAEYQGVVLDQQQWVLFKVDLLPGWHTYGKEPGDAGLPFTLNIDQKGVDVGEILWQKPIEFEFSGITSFGYKDRAFFLVPITFSSDYFNHDETIVLSGTASWLVCESTCIPQLIHFETGFPVISSFDQVVPSVFFDQLRSTADIDLGQVVAKSYLDQRSVSLILLMIGFAFLGGLLLNIMPCVFPVLALKVFDLVEKSGQEPKTVRKQGLLYMAGVIDAFILLVLVLQLLRYLGVYVGWGFQLQSPIFLIILMGVVLWVAFYLLEWIRIPQWLLRLTSLFSMFRYQGQSQSGKSYFSGFLAVFLATPCTAPFMAPALGFALSQSFLYQLLLMLVMGIGFGFPFLFLAFFPGFSRFFPKPGTWMVTFKKWLALPMILTFFWLAWVLLLPFYSNQNDHFETGQEAFSQQRLDALIDQKRLVFVDVTAAWCLTCQFNKKRVLDREPIQDFFKHNNIVYMQADWTRYDPAITDYLAGFGLSGVPAYIFYAPGKEPVVLSSLLDQEMILNLLVLEK